MSGEYPKEETYAGVMTILSFAEDDDVIGYVT